MSDNESVGWTIFKIILGISGFLLMISDPAWFMLGVIVLIIILFIKYSSDGETEASNTQKHSTEDETPPGAQRPGDQVRTEDKNLAFDNVDLTPPNPESEAAKQVNSENDSGDSSAPAAEEKSRQQEDESQDGAEPERPESEADTAVSQEEGEINRLIGDIKDAEEEERRKAVEELVEFANSNPEQIRSHIDFCIYLVNEEQDPDNRKRILDILDSIDTEQARKEIRDARLDPDPEVSRYAGELIE